MHRLFVAELPEGGGSIALDAAATRRVRVLRLEIDDAIALFDGRGNESSARVASLDPATLTAEPRRAVTPGNEPRVVLVQVMPKGAKLDTIVRMTAELGVAEIHLAISERAIARPDEARAEGRVERLLRVAREASRQARRTTVPAIHPPRSLIEVARAAPPEAARLVVWEERASLPFIVDEGASEAWIVVGPEGGLAPREVAALEGYAPVGLGPFVLRVETAAPTAVALALDRMRAAPNGR